MKRFNGSKVFVAILAICLVATAGCSSTNESDTEITTTETTTEASTAETTVAETTEAEETKASTVEITLVDETDETEEYVKEIRPAPVPEINPNNDYITSEVFVIDLSGTEIRDVNADYYSYVRSFNVPQFSFDTESAKNVNQYIMNLMNDIDSQKDDFYWTSNSFCYKYDNYITLTFDLVGDWDIDYYFMWTFDVSTGEIVSNQDIFAASNSEYSSITEAATVATTDSINNYLGQYDPTPVIVDGKLNSENSYVGDMDNVTKEYYYNLTFNDENINDSMNIGLDSNGTLIFISHIFSFGGAEYYQEVYTADGNFISSFFEN